MLRLSPLPFSNRWTFAAVDEEMSALLLAKIDRLGSVSIEVGGGRSVRPDVIEQLVRP
jgi:hypothetical protein